VIAVAVARPDHESRLRDAFLAAGTTLWLGYTYLYPSLQGVHATLPACPFYALTGHPCPFCGGTRSFAAMWQGDVLHAARLYPLGPLLFVLTFPVAVYAIWAVVSGRTLNVALSNPVMKLITVLGATALAISWSLKLFWLGN